MNIEVDWKRIRDGDLAYWKRDGEDIRRQIIDARFYDSNREEILAAMPYMRALDRQLEAENLTEKSLAASRRHGVLHWRGLEIKPDSSPDEWVRLTDRPFVVDSDPLAVWEVVSPLIGLGREDVERWATASGLIPAATAARTAKEEGESRRAATEAALRRSEEQRQRKAEIAAAEAAKVEAEKRARALREAAPLPAFRR